MRKRRVLLFALAMLITAQACAYAAVSLAPLKKTDYPTNDIVLSGVDPNVLFLLDTGSAMAFSKNGIMPLFGDGRSPAERAALVAQCTYGIGARPISVNGTESGASQAERWGRDVDSTNNHPDDLDAYYSPYDDPAEGSVYPYFLTFKNRTKATASTLPSYTADDLMPNDSRMYMMKLVLWRLTQPENAQLFSNINAGMATTIQTNQYANTGVIADVLKYPPYDAHGIWINGDLPTWAGGDNSYSNSSWLFTGIWRDLYETTATVAQWRHVNRGLLRVPFDKFYVLNPSTGNYDKTNMLKYFRTYIDGIEDVPALMPNVTPGNEELLPDGLSPIATTLYGEYHLPGNNYKGFPLIDYGANGYEGKVHTFNDIGGDVIRLREFVPTDAAHASTTGLTSRQAVGGVLDFFSPKPSALSFSYTNSTNTGTAGSYPVTGSCQNNWVVLFTAGNDEPTAPAGAGTHAILNSHEAALKLFKDSLKMKGREWNSSTMKWEAQDFDMDNGIRTLVVGFVDPLDTDPASIQLRNTLRKIAQYGNPINSDDVANPDDWYPNPAAEPYFANDVPSLIKAMKSVLELINTKAIAAGSPVIRPMTEGDNAVMAMFTSNYDINALDQWQSNLYKYDLSAAVSQDWNINDRIDKNSRSSRNLYTATNMNGRGGVSKVNQTIVENQIGLSSAKAAAFKDWLFDYGADNGGSDVGPFGDIMHSGITVVGKPSAASLLADPDIATRDRKLYVHTNRGVLHQIDFATGDETWAFIPPNVFQNRLKAMKFDASDVMYNDNGITGIRSMPLTVLDGMLAAEDVNFNAPAAVDDHTVLIGCLGWGGNGLYAMDVTHTGSNDASAGKPTFLWAVDNARFADQEPTLTDGVKLWGEANGGNVTNQYNYSDLGLTIQAAIPVKTSSDEYVAILPGGVGYNLGTDSHGKAFYFIKPANGEIISKIDTGNAGSRVNDNAEALGMGVTPVTYITDDNAVLKYFYTADSEGNIFLCNSEGAITSWEFDSVFSMRSYADSGFSGMEVAAVGGKPIATSLALLAATANTSSTFAAANDRLLFGGTNDIMGVKSATNTDRYVNGRNEQHFIFGINVTKAQASGGIENFDSSNVKKWKYFTDGLSPTYSQAVAYSDTVNLPSASDVGWSLRLRPKNDDPANPREAEYVSTDPYLYDNDLLVATFYPAQRELAESTCPALGDSKLYIINPLTGGSGSWLDGKGKVALTFKDIKIAGISIYKDYIYLGVQSLSSGAFDNFKQEVQNNGLVNPGQLNGNTWYFSRNQLTPNKPVVTPNVPHVHYWRERIQ